MQKRQNEKLYSEFLLDFHFKVVYNIDMETVKINQFKADLLYFTNYAIENNGRVTFSPEDGTITFSRELSDQEYLESISGLWDSIDQASKDLQSGKDKGTPLRGRSLAQFMAEE